MGRYGLQPNICSCFPSVGGYCFKSLACRSKPSTQEDFKATQKSSTKSRPIVQTWRADGSHENGPVPQGRLPKGWEV